MSTQFLGVLDEVIIPFSQGSGNNRSVVPSVPGEWLEPQPPQGPTLQLLANKYP